MINDDSFSDEHFANRGDCLNLDSTYVTHMLSREASGTTQRVDVHVGTQVGWRVDSWKKIHDGKFFSKDTFPLV